MEEDGTLVRLAAACRIGAGLVVPAAVGAAFAVAPASATAQAVRTFAIRNGVTSVALTVRHSTGLRPPAILLSTRPANLPCSVLSYRYHAIREKGTFDLRIRCHKVGSGARGRLVFRSPYVRVFTLRNGSGTVRLRLDKFPGTAVPLGQLTTRPRAAKCSATPAAQHVGRHLFTASARVSCHGLPRNAKGVLAAGGLSAPSPPTPGRSVDVPARPLTTATRSQTTASAAAVKPCSSARKLSALGHSISWRYCYGTGIVLGPWQSAYFGQAPTQRCPSGWINTLQVTPVILRVFLANLYPFAVYVEPTTAWAWSYSSIFGTVTNWQFSGDITAMWSWNCYQVE